MSQEREVETGVEVWFNPGFWREPTALAQTASGLGLGLRFRDED